MATLLIANQSVPTLGAFSVPITLDPQGSSIAALQFDFTIPQGTTFQSVAVGPSASQASKQVSSAVVGNAVRVIIFGLNQNLIQAGVVAQINLTATANGKTTFALANVTASDPNGQAVALQTTAGTLTIGGKMSTSQQQFDSSLTAFLTANTAFLADVAALLTAVNALIAKVKTLEVPVDLTTELNQVTTAMQAVQTQDTTVQSTTTQATGA